MTEAMELPKPKQSPESLLTADGTHSSDEVHNEGDTTPLAMRLPKIIRFDDLARCGEEIWIENSGEIYRLRRTKQGKLILTK